MFMSDTKLWDRSGESALEYPTSAMPVRDGPEERRVGHGGVSLYAYVGADPINFTDTSGTDASDLFPDEISAAHDATLTYFNRNREHGGGIYRITSASGRSVYTYTERALGSSSGRITLYANPNCAPFTCTLVAAWHTHVRSPYPSDDDELAVQTQGRSLYLGFDGRTYVLLTPGDGQPVDSRNSFRVREPPSYGDQYDTYITNLRRNFGPLGTAALVAYENHCVFGDVDVCEGMPSPSLFSPKEVPSE